MRAGGMVWLAAVLLAGALAGALLLRGPDLRVQMMQSLQARTVIIGTSVVGNAFPSRGKGLLGDDAPYARIAINRMPASQILTMADAALRGGQADLIVIEGYPFIRDFSDELRGEQATGLFEQGAEALIAMGRQLSESAAILAWRGGLWGNPLAKGLAERDIDSPTKVSKRTLRVIYPMAVRPARDLDRLRAFAAAARAAGVTVVLVAPPRSELAAGWNSAATLAQVQQALTDLGATLGWQVFSPARPWPDHLFTDHAHLNRAGRERFLAEFQQFAGPHHGG